MVTVSRHYPDAVEDVWDACTDRRAHPALAHAGQRRAAPRRPLPAGGQRGRGRRALRSAAVVRRDLGVRRRRELDRAAPGPRGRGHAVHAGAHRARRRRAVDRVRPRRGRRRLGLDAPGADHAPRVATPRSPRPRPRRGWSAPRACGSSPSRARPGARPRSPAGDEPEAAEAAAKRTTAAYTATGAPPVTIPGFGRVHDATSRTRPRRSPAGRRGGRARSSPGRTGRR